MTKFGIGQPVERLEDPRLLTGRGRYTEDINLADQAHGHVLRSPHAHAAIRAIDTKAARDAPGVLAVYTAADTKAAGFGTIQCKAPVDQKDGSPMNQPPFPILPEERTLYVGQPVAFVVAETVDQAKDAAELIAVDYDPLPAATDTRTAADPEAPQLWDEAPRNTCFLWAQGDETATAAAIDGAPRRLSLELVNNRLIINSIEARSAIGEWDGERLTLRTPTQGPHSVRDQLAEDIFKLPKDKIRVVTDDVGGGFGLKIFLYPEQPLVLLAARDLGRPVKWVAERSADGFVSDYQGRDQVNRVEVGYDDEGRILGLRSLTTGNLGAYISNFAPYIVADCGAGNLTGVYVIPAIYTEVRAVFTNTVPVDAYRGAGHPEAIYVVERALNAIARELGIDQAEMRRGNFIQPDQFPYETPIIWTYDSGDFEGTMEQATRHADLAGFEARRAEAAVAGKLRGLGIGCYVKGVRFGMGETARLEVGQNGDITIYIGNQSNGQGHETAFAQIVAAKLDIDIERVRLVQGDTDLVKTGNGTGGSRSLLNGGIACDKAAGALIEEGKELAADLLEVAAVDIEYADGTFSVAGTDRRLGLGEIAGHDRGFAAENFFVADDHTYPNGCHIAEVEIDGETGAAELVAFTVVDDYGVVVNPLLLEGQVHGGIAQGIGQALMEQSIYDRSGQLVTGSFMDYCMPRADDLPSFTVDFNRNAPCRTNPMGIKGAGETGAVGAPAAVVHAVLDALAPLGIGHIDMPTTPERIWRAIQDAK